MSIRTLPNPIASFDPIRMSEKCIVYFTILHRSWWLKRVEIGIFSCDILIRIEAFNRQSVWAHPIP